MLVDLEASVLGMGCAGYCGLQVWVWWNIVYARNSDTSLSLIHRTQGKTENENKESKIER
jgi:hypothetical protein